MKTFLIGFGTLVCLLFLLASCRTPRPLAILPNLSPPVVTAQGRSFDRAEQVAKTIPNSTVLVAHGSASFALYPRGTVLVIQRIAWEHLQPGMTGVYYLDQQRSPAMIGGVISHLEGGAWMVPGVAPENYFVADPRNDIRRMTRDGYIGVVAAAFYEKDLSDPSLVLREAPPEIVGTCALRCHVPSATTPTGGR